MPSATGSQAEQLALEYLQAQGLQLLTRNFRGRYGEIDLIMRHGTVLVFIEVRLRNSKQYGGADASITHNKQQKLRLTASQYMQRYGEQACRFDTILFSQLKHDCIIWQKQAFDYVE
jgi:putative endonuclease